MIHDKNAEIPAPLSERVSQFRTLIAESLEPSEFQRLSKALTQPELKRQFSAVLAASRYAAEQFRRSPKTLLELVSSDLLFRPLGEDELELELKACSRDPEKFSGELRRFRHKQLLRIIWRDLNRLASTRETMHDTSSLADASIRAALVRCEQQLVASYGRPMEAGSDDNQNLIVLALGKLGGYELNLSSDVDLMFVFARSGETSGGPRSLSNEEFFTRLGRALIAQLDKVTVDGFAFRVDMRLRPYGESGALVHNFSALENYYQEQGRDWERYALIKARPVTGSADEQMQLNTLIRAFVYRRYVDYRAVEALRQMKALILAEVRRRGLEGDVKLGRGGIREIEFIAQCFQLIRGGRDVSLQSRELLPVLDQCVVLGLLPKHAGDELKSAYLFLRDTEHAIQAWDDKQTQSLPEGADAAAALAWAMGFSDHASFLRTLNEHRELVADHFAALIAPVDEPQDEEIDPQIWSDQCSSHALSELGFHEPEAVANQLVTLHKSRLIAQLQPDGRARLDRLMPLLIQASADLNEPDLAVQRAIPLVQAVARRSAYFLLLIENPPALADLVSLCGASPWIAEQLSQRPALLDELLDRASLYSAPDKAALESELRQLLGRIPFEDLEATMETLRYFKASQVLRVAASEIAGRLPLMEVSDKLSFIAEVSLGRVLDVAWQQMSARYGEPEREGSGTGFQILGYGKLGGIELSYASDLDLVFIFDANARAMTRGEKAVDNATFYTRLAQRIVHMLETYMTLGRLYEVDLRLRPSGASGLLVRTIAAFEKYQYENAWTWEHQALVRARPVAGDEALGNRLLDLRRQVISKKRDELRLAREVAAMREKMRDHHSSGQAAKGFELKQDPGGIVDIEFMVQYAVLAWSSREPALAVWSDNVRILESLADTRLLPDGVCSGLVSAYLAMRSAVHECALQNKPARADEARFHEHRKLVQTAWRELLGHVDTSGYDFFESRSTAFLKPR
ncbi:MAG: bifunctional [glutamate--ammonia ligase]-adenylyl-L-tyrosine phosphorylase/[glutamate--ammonia-ligase] adenylyltransferase [Pseudomonadota bacterium]